MRLTTFEKLVLAWCLVLLACGVALFWADAKAAPAPKRHALGPFMLVLRYSHRQAVETKIQGHDIDLTDTDLVDRVVTVGPFSGWDTCDGAALEAQARQADPAHNAYVTASCLYLGPRRP